jgi:hypothetical protein
MVLGIWYAGFWEYLRSLSFIYMFLMASTRFLAEALSSLSLLFMEDQQFSIGLKGHGNESDFLGFLHIPARHRSLTLRFDDFNFKFSEIFVIKKRLPDSPSREVTRLHIDTIFSNL